MKEYRIYKIITGTKGSQKAYWAGNHWNEHKENAFPYSLEDAQGWSQLLNAKYEKI